MKEGIYSAEVVPSTDYLDYFSLIKEHNSSSDESQILKGHIRLKLTKAIKAKSISVKFKGETIIRHVRVGDEHLTEVSTALLPKLKTRVQQKPTLLNAGDHILPWELRIPNIYPRSLSSKRGVIQYKIEMKMTLGINRAIIVSSPFVIRRHMLSSQDSAPNVNTNKYENTVPDQLYYEIEAPKVVCIEQGYIPMSIRYKCYGNKPVKLIFTQIIQAEIYRNRSLSKAEADLAVVASKKSSTIVGQKLYRSYKNGDIALSKFFKRIQPVTVNTIDDMEEHDYILMPLLIKHELDSALVQNTESPLVTIHHQLEITFNFGLGYDEIRAKVPVVISTVPDSHIIDQINAYGDPEAKPIPKYNMEAFQNYTLPRLVELLDSSDASSISQKRGDESCRNAIMNDSTISTCSTIYNIKSNHPLDRIDGEKLLKKSSSDQNMGRLRSTSQSSLGSTSFSGKRRSITPPPQSSSAPRPTSILHYDQRTPINYALNDNGSSKKLDTKSLHNYIPASKSLSTSTKYVPVESPVNTFSGLAPPPRRSRRKDTFISDSKIGLSRTSTNGSSCKSSRPTSPVTSYPTPFVPATSMMHLSTASDKPPLSPHSARRNMSNQSRSSSTSGSFSNSSFHYQTGVPMMRQVRSSSVDDDISSICSSISSLVIHPYEQDENSDPFSMKHHYVGAELPPIPMGPRPRLPSVSQSSLENRRTIYYENESDDDDDNVL